jgi:hypothetical protein
MMSTVGEGNGSVVKSEETTVSGMTFATSESESERRTHEDQSKMRNR